ncbi:MAG: hypothetical protein ACI4JX_02875 [Oscillospiraceae bacterium]
MKKNSTFLKQGFKIYGKNLVLCTAVCCPAILLAALAFAARALGVYFVRLYSPDFTDALYFMDADFFLMLPSVIKYALLVLIIPLYYGIYLWLAELKRGNVHKIYESFGFYTRFSLIFKCILIKLTDLIFKTAVLLPVLIPLSASVWVISLAFRYSYYGIYIISIGLCLAAVTAVCFIACLTFAQQSFSLDYVYVTNPEKPFLWIVKTAFGTMKKRKASGFALKLILSFFFIPCVLIVPIPFVMPAVILCIISYNADICAKIS